jgi:hypothetical protein
MAFKHRTFVRVPPPTNADLDTLNSWHTLEQIRVDTFYDEERQRIADYYGKRKNIINTSLLIFQSTFFAFNLLYLFTACIVELPWEGGVGLTVSFILTAHAAYVHGEERYPVMS